MIGQIGEWVWEYFVLSPIGLPALAVGAALMLVATRRRDRTIRPYIVLAGLLFVGLLSATLLSVVITLDYLPDFQRMNSGNANDIPFWSRVVFLLLTGPIYLLPGLLLGAFVAGFFRHPRSMLWYIVSVTVLAGPVGFGWLYFIVMIACVTGGGCL